MRSPSALLDDVAKMNADAKLDPTFRRKAGVALDHARLHLEGAAHGVDHAAELDDDPVAGALDDAAMMGGYCRVDEVAAETPKARKRPVLVGAGEPAVTDDIRDQNRRKLSRLGHCAALRQAEDWRKKLSTQSWATPGDGKGQHCSARGPAAPVATDAFGRRPLSRASRAFHRADHERRQRVRTRPFAKPSADGR